MSESALPSTPSDPTSRHAALSRKAARHLLPIMCLVYFMAFVDRTNLGLAKTALHTDLGIGEAAYGLGAGVFFISYALLEVPSNLILYRVGARTWVTRIAITWGLLCACMIFVQGERSFFVIRFLLGAAEAGLFPALMYVVTLWFSQPHRVTVIGIIYFAPCVALMIGGPVGGALMELDGAAGLFGWQWMFLVEGLLTVAVGGLVWLLLPSRPEDARWLGDGEAAIITENAVGHAQGVPVHTSLRGNLKVAFGRPVILALAAVYFANQVISVAIQYNFPSIIENLDVGGPFLVGLVSGSAGAFALAGVIIVPWLQRRWRNEIRVIAVCTVGTALVAVLYTLVDNPVGRVALIDVGMFLLVGILPVFWSVATSRMTGLMAAAGLAFVNTVGLLGGFTGPYLYGWAESRGGASLGFAVLVVASLIGVLLVPLLWRALRSDYRRTHAENHHPDAANRAAGADLSLDTTRSM